MIREAKTLVKQLIDETNEGTNKIFSQKMCYHQQFCCLHKYQKQENHGLFENNLFSNGTDTTWTLLDLEGSTYIEQAWNHIQYTQ